MWGNWQPPGQEPGRTLFNSPSSKGVYNNLLEGSGPPRLIRRLHSGIMKHRLSISSLRSEVKLSASSKELTCVLRTERRSCGDPGFRRQLNILRSFLEAASRNHLRLKHLQRVPCWLYTCASAAGLPFSPRTWFGISKCRLDLNSGRLLCSI